MKNSQEGFLYIGAGLFVLSYALIVLIGVPTLMSFPAIVLPTTLWFIGILVVAIFCETIGMTDDRGYLTTCGLVILITLVMGFVVAIGEFPWELVGTRDNWFGWFLILWSLMTILVGGFIPLPLVIILLLHLGKVWIPGTSVRIDYSCKDIGSPKINGYKQTFGRYIGLSWYTLREASIPEHIKDVFDAFVKDQRLKKTAIPELGTVTIRFGLIAWSITDHKTNTKHKINFDI